MILFNRIILSPLVDKSNEQNVVDIISKIYEIYLKEEYKSLNYEKKIGLNLGFSEMEGEKDDELSSISTYQSLVNDIVNVNCISKNESFDIDCQIVQFLEQIPLILLDGICNEYSVFYINSMSFPIDGKYKFLQEKLINITCNLVQSFYSKEKCGEVLNFFKDNEYINTRFINETKLNFILSISQTLLNLAKSDTLEEFNNYLIKNECNSNSNYISLEKELNTSNSTRNENQNERMGLDFFSQENKEGSDLLKCNIIILFFSPFLF